MAGIKQIGQQQGSAPQAKPQAVRYRLGLSDGSVWVSGMLATQLNTLVTSNQIVEGTYMRLNEICISQLNGRK